MKKIFSLLLALCMMLSLTAVATADSVAASDIKIGLICIGDENEGYSANHINGLRKACAALGVSEEQVIYKFNIPESEAAYEAAIDLAEQGCNVIFANSFGHETYVFLAAEEYPEIEFCHATGTQAGQTGLDNTHNFFTAIYEARYVSGVVAGMKLNQMIADGKITAEQAKMGYVGAFPFAEVKSGYTAFYLGAKSVCPTVTMDVKFTNSWGDLALEKEAAEALIASGCVLISQHADTTGAPSACEVNAVPCVGYNISMIPAAPNAALVSAACNWDAYFAFALQQVMAGNKFPSDWGYGYADGAVCTTELNAATIAPGTAEKVAEIEAALKAGTMHVFNTATFTVANAGSYYELDDEGHVIKAFGFDTDGDFVPDFGDAIVTDDYGTYFAESVLRSAPYFEMDIVGITLID